VWILCERPFGANVALFSLFFPLFFSLIQLWVVEPPASCEGGPLFSTYSCAQHWSLFSFTTAVAAA